MKLFGRPLQHYLNLGLDSLDEKDHRGARLSNLLSLVGTVASLGFGCFYLVEGGTGLLAPALVCFFFAPLFFVIPLSTRFGVVVAASLVLLNLMALTVINTYLLSRDSGLHTALLIIAPAVGVLLLGVGRIKFIFALALVGLTASVIPEIYFLKPSSWVETDPEQLLRIRLNIMISNGFIITIAIFYAFLRMTRAEEALEAEHARSERLLENLLPQKIAARLKATPDRIIADKFDAVTILFADIVDFTPRAATMPAESLVQYLNEVFTAFDAQTGARGLEKIKTIGDAYMVVAGLPEAREDHAAAIADLALEMVSISQRLSERMNEPVAVRIGIHTGPAVAGVIGKRKIFYDVWGDTVNTAARMESQGEAGRIQITRETYEALKPTHLCEARGVIDVKGKGSTETWWLVGRRVQCAHPSDRNPSSNTETHLSGIM